jgi:transglutaminase-like putative cysteine protease
MSGVIASATSLPAGQLSRVALLYLLAVVMTSLTLMSRDMPLWLVGVGLACVLWRGMVYLGRWAFPGPWQKAVCVTVCCVGIALQYRTGLSLEVYVALLITGLSLKSLEVYHTRSAQLFLYIAILVLMAFLLFAQGFIAMVLACLQLALIVASLVAIHSDPQRVNEHPFAPLKTAGITVGLAAPLLVFLFIVMPRLPPIWAMPLQKQEARIGMGEDMSPGDFSKPSRSAELAFRAGFFGDIPPPSALYWRGTVLDEFDGRRWKNSGDGHSPWQNTGSRPKPQGQPLYNVVMEPHGHRWVFTLSQARLADDRISTNGDDLFRYRQEVFERVTYDVWPAETGKDLQELSAAERQRYTALPNTGNPRARELARQWRQEAISDQSIVRQALDRFHQTFVYTLEPPLLGADSVDQFLFETQHGYCEHFASAFVFLMRAAGVPARVVMGYQGGQRNLQEHYVSVRQYDAHAWAEVWFPTTGWQRFDPTSAVAPERVEQGFAEWSPDSTALQTLLGLQNRGRQSLLGLLSIKLDYLDYLVGRWVLGYDPDRQQSLLRRLGLASPQALLMAFAVGFLTMLGAFLLFLRLRDRPNRHEDALTARYRRLCTQYARLGWIRAPSETPGQFARRVMDQNGPGAQSFLTISARYESCRYRQDIPDKTDLPRLMRQLALKLMGFRWIGQRVARR